jgi:uncharacterized protein YecT (DUF1311 family)
LAASKKAFLSYRQTHCELARISAAGGNSAGDMLADCEFRLNRDYARELNDKDSYGAFFSGQSP